MAVLRIGNEGGKIPMGCMRDVCGQNLGNPGNGRGQVPTGNKRKDAPPPAHKPRSGRKK